MRNRSNENNYHWDYREYQGNYGQNPAHRSNSRGLKIFLITMGVVVLLVGALCIGASAWSHKNPQPENPSIGNDQLEHLPEIDQQNKPEDNVPDTTEDGLLTPAGIYKKCAPSVVGIVSYGSSSTAQGTGIILSENGYIITNAHVVSDGEQYEVVLQNGDSYDATLIGVANEASEPGFARAIAGAVGFQHNTFDTGCVGEILQGLLGDAREEMDKHHVAIHFRLHLQRAVGFLSPQSFFMEVYA